MEQTIESRVATAILEKAIDSIEIEGKTYDIAPPSVATLILISELVSTLPVVERVPKEQVVYSVLHNAKDFAALGDICAILILGAKNLTEQREEVEEQTFLHFFKRKRKVVKTIDRKAELARYILENMRPTTIFNIIVKRLQDMEVGDFFAITTSLSEANILKPTKEEVEKS